MEISSKYLYNGELEAHSSAEWRNLNDMNRVDVESEEYSEGMVKDRLNPLIWIDTAGAYFGDSEEVEGTNKDGKTVPLPPILQTASKFNEGEVELVKVVYRDLRLNQLLEKDEIGVISPYKAQVDLIRASLAQLESDGTRCEVSTVDGFQGREKEVIILSLVRSNPMKEIGFLSDVRRLNVAITRPKRLLIVIGDSQSVATHPFISLLFKSVNGKGSVLNVRDIIDIVKSRGESDDELRNHMNSGTHKTHAHLKVREKPPAEEEPKQPAEKKKKKKEKNKKPELTADGAEIEEKPEALPDLAEKCTNPYQIDNELFDRIEALASDPAASDCIKVYRKVQEEERARFVACLANYPQLELTFQKKPFLMKIGKKSGLREAQPGPAEPAEPPEPAESEADLQEEERRLKLREKREKQQAEKQKKKEEEARLKAMNEEEILDYIDQKRIEEEEQRAKFCPALFGSTGKPCLKNIQISGLVCKYCNVKYCITHVYASMHGCDEADERHEKQKFRAKMQVGSSGDEPQSEAAKAFLEAKLRRMRQEMEDKRKPKPKEDKKEEKAAPAKKKKK